MNMLDKIYQDLLKQYQRGAIKGACENKIVIHQNLVTLKRNAIQDEAARVKSMMSATSNDLDKLVKGKVGHKIHEVLKQQETAIDKINQ